MSEGRESLFSVTLRHIAMLWPHRHEYPGDRSLLRDRIRRAQRIKRGEAE